MSHSTSLEQIFAASVNQGTLENAAEEMAANALCYSGLEAEFTQVLESAIDAGSRGEPYVLDAVNRSGYQVASPQEGALLCSELLKAFKKAYASQE
jgi:hypothetical protein